MLAFIASDPMRTERLAAWLICLAVLTPAVWRLLRWRQRYLDTIWLVVALLVVNRLSYLFQAPAAASHGTSTFLALAMAVVAWTYQRRDA